MAEHTNPVHTTLLNNEQVLTYINSVSNVSQLIQPQVRTCLQQRTNYLQWNEEGIHMFIMQNLQPFALMTF